MPLPPEVRIVENAWPARLAAAWLRTPRVAMVWNTRILLWGVTEVQFMANIRWVRHELKHVEQFRQWGTARFILLYLWSWILQGYHYNRFEVEARAAEELPHPLAG